MKIVFCSIVFNAEFVLESLIESIYPYAHKIIFVDGVVEYWQKQGYTGSTDRTCEIIENFPDPENKIILHKQQQAKEKTELCRIFMKDVPEDTHYVWGIDGDEIFKAQDIERTIDILKVRKPDSLCFKSLTFFGGFDHVLTGFEAEHNFKRVLRYEKGCEYVQHRPPTLSCETKPPLNSNVQMYHYSYVSPHAVFQKLRYYKDEISKQNCIDNYFEKVWLPWVLYPERRTAIEKENRGVHEFIPSYRGDCYTAPFTGEHPEAIKKRMAELKDSFQKQLNEFTS